MNTVIDIVKSDMGYFVTAFLCVLFGFGAGCGITEAIFRWEGDNDEKHDRARHGRVQNRYTKTEKIKRLYRLAEKLNVQIGGRWK